MSPLLEAGSFRDRTARVFYRDQGVLRGLDARALAEWQALRATRFFARQIEQGKLVATRQLEGTDPEWAAILQHETIPCVSYPYEWCFGMLRDAALLHLELLQEALAEDMILKDGSAYNVQWQGSRPVFIDIPSLVRYQPGQPWFGYRQFCQLFLFPLLLQAHRNVPFQPWLRGSLEGIPAEHANAMFSWRDLFRPGVFAHVFLQAHLQAGPSSGVRRQLAQAGFHKQMIEANLRGMHRLVAGLGWRPGTSRWSEYERTCGYSTPQRVHKERFVADALAGGSWDLVWDLGCNTGRFSRLAAEHARYVVALDSDPLTIERLYQQLRQEHHPRILPLVGNLADPSPGLGWRGRERRSLPERGQPDLTLCLALLHHLVLGSNLPMREVVDWLAGLTRYLVIEFVTPDDPMARALLEARDEPADDYTLPHFESCLGARFEVLRRESLPSGTRILYFARTRL